MTFDQGRRESVGPGASDRRVGWPTAQGIGASSADVIVVGGGHNGLACAAYLARAGIDTLLVESRADVGGCASTVSDLGARFNICNCDHTMVRAMPLIDELDLAAHGLRYLEPESGYLHLFHDRSTPWVHYPDLDRTLDGLALTYPGAVDAYRRYYHDAVPVAQLIIDMAQSPANGPRLLSKALQRRPAVAARLLDWSRRSVANVLGTFFDDWQMVMPAVSTGPTVWGLSPEQPGSGLAAALYATRHLIKTGRPVGGSGALTDALRASFEAAGGTVICSSCVDHLVVGRDGVQGVRLTSGETLGAPIVVAATDPQRVFVDWLHEMPLMARRRVRQWRSRPAQEGYESKIDAVIEGRPRYRDAERLEAVYPGLNSLEATMIISPDPAGLAQAHARRPAGLVADAPTFITNVPSVLDESMRADDGLQILSLEVLFTPYSLSGGWPASLEPSRWLELWSGLIEPGSATVDRWRAMTPEVYERDFGMHRGHTPAYTGTPLGTLLGRQPEVSRYRTPIAGLYLTGAATFPGAGVFGASGRNTAEVVRRDCRGPLRRRLGPIRRRLRSGGMTGVA